MTQIGLYISDSKEGEGLKMKKTIKVVFTKDINKHSIGDEASVSLGYAQNYLLPNGLAVDVNEPMAKEVIEKIKQERALRQEKFKNTEEMAQKLEGKVIEIRAKVSSAKKLYGSIGAEEIASKLRIDHKQIKMQPIKTIGEHKIQLDLGHNIKANIVVKVEALSK